jgi:hypothetical protein
VKRRSIRENYANVIASLALFIALGGSAAAAATLGRDSVGAPQIRKDAVRSPEIVSGAVRSSELRDQGIKVADVATAARFALLPDVRVAELDDGLPVSACDELPACNDILTLNLSSSGAASRAAEPLPPEPARSWLIQAKATVLTQNETTTSGNDCGLVNTAARGSKAVLDEVDAPRFGGTDAADDVALSAVVRKGAGNPTIALRCTAHDVAPQTDGLRDVVQANFVKITALEIGAVTGP